MKSIKLFVISIILSSLAMADIYGIDNRKIINYPENHKLSELKKVGRVIISSINGGISKSCSGTLVGRNLVLTAAHCIYDDINHVVWSGKTTFSLNQSGNHKPYGSYVAKKVYLPSDYFENMSEEAGKISQYQRENDYAIVVLNKNIGDAHGWHGLFNDTSSYEKEVEVLSYPSDKNKHLVYEKCTATEDYFSEKTYKFDCDTITGTSGAGLFDTDNKVIGVASTAGRYSAQAFRFTEDSFKIIRGWIKDDV